MTEKVEMNEKAMRQRLASMRLSQKELNLLTDIVLEEATPAEDTGEFELISWTELYDEAKEIADKGNVFSGLSTGYSTIDRMTMGLNGGDLAVIYGYTSMGKSQLGQNIALKVAQAGNPVLFIGLELTSKQNEARMIRMGGDDPLLPFMFPAKQDIKYTEIQGAIQRAVEAGDCRLVIVDQLQDLIHSTVNEQGEITQIMAELKRAALVNEVPIIVMSHVNRGGGIENGPPPLTVLKGSSSIEQKADIALAVWQDKDAEYGEVGHAEMQVLLTKNRQKGMANRTTTLKIREGMALEEKFDPGMITFSKPQKTYRPNQLAI